MNNELVRYLRLVSEIKLEWSKVKALQDKLKFTLRQSLPEFILASTIGKILHDFYTGIENIFEKIARETGEGIPNGEAWHKELLTVMSLDIETVRRHVINSKLASELDEYLRFRHVFRNIYGDELNWGSMKHLVDKMPEIMRNLEESIEEFCQFLKSLAE
jgi:hypothetical protein